MEMEIVTMESKCIARHCFDKPGSWVSCHSRKHQWEHLHKYPCNVPCAKLQMGPQRLSSLRRAPHNFVLASVKYPIRQLVWRHPSCRTFAMSVDLEKGTSLVPQGDGSIDNDESLVEDLSQKLLSEPPGSNVLKSLLADSERTKLIRKLSEANQYNRFLKRQTLVGLAEELAKSGTQQGLRKINGKYIPSYLLSRLEAVHEKIKEEIKGVEAIKLKDIELFWYGMAETVQVMGSFDGWSEGEHMSSEYSGDFSKFSTTLKLRPGQYEIKFLVDGEWRLSPELPVTGGGMMQNNLLIVE
ncbi:protein PTST, chloroplastic isoform X1 [Magnolia sinica]|uniref:protein PTST, chloroplastic isoform X1 n=1 Tax=Magnolia sinica TaxID=86752 RepID=UPI0026584155|nr:protein PTST, chloroplastic isoform X1 [Magnolia sinica]